MPLQLKSSYPSYYKDDDIIQMYTHQGYSLALIVNKEAEEDDTKFKTQVITNGNFANLKEKPDFDFVDLKLDAEVNSLACNASVSLLQISDGMLCSWGHDVDETGVLGQGERRKITSPQGIDDLIDYTIRGVSLGPKHACATDMSGRLFLWG